MRLIIAVALLVSSFAASAVETVSRRFSFTYMDRSVVTRTYHNCDSVEDTLRDHLRTLGAQNIRVTCSGGIQNWGNRWEAWPVSLSARFVVPANRDNAQRLVIADRGFNTNCDFNVQLLSKLLRELPNARMISKNDRCRGSEGSYSFTVDAAL